ncbi:MAG: hypothetical protein RMJ97_06950 [Raineya sp.]|nr:hypothetical protein [Raineya sp.]MDW8296607.1 hypothetical protein [Raineya sp.]
MQLEYLQGIDTESSETFENLFEGDLPADLQNYIAELNAKPKEPSSSLGFLKILSSGNIKSLIEQVKNDPDKFTNWVRSESFAIPDDVQDWQLKIISQEKPHLLTETHRQRLEQTPPSTFIQNTPVSTPDFALQNQPTEKKELATEKKEQEQKPSFWQKNKTIILLGTGLILTGLLAGIIYSTRKSKEIDGVLSGVKKAKRKNKKSV